MNKELQKNEKFIRCAGFIAEMIKKYGSEILDEQKDEENEGSPLSFLQFFQRPLFFNIFVLQ